MLSSYAISNGRFTRTARAADPVDVLELFLKRCHFLNGVFQNILFRQLHDTPNL